MEFTVHTVKQLSLLPAALFAVSSLLAPTASAEMKGGASSRPSPIGLPAPMACASDPEILEKLRPIVSEHLGVPVEQIKLETAFSDLGADSLDVVEIVMAVEENFGIEINDLDLTTK